MSLLPQHTGRSHDMVIAHCQEIWSNLCPERREMNQYLPHSTLGTKYSFAVFFLHHRTHPPISPRVLAESHYMQLILQNFALIYSFIFQFWMGLFVA